MIDGNKSMFAQKSAKQHDDKQLLVFNEVSGYNMVRKAVGEESKTIPDNIYIDQDYSIYTHFLN